MARKLGISPDVSYMLGVYNCNTGSSQISIATASTEMVERFVRIAVSLGTRPDAILITREEYGTKASISNSKLKKLFDNALEKRDRIFKYRNEYSASYFAGMFDCNGAADGRGIFIRGMQTYDSIILERIGFHTTANSAKCYIRKPLDFMMFISPFSVKARLIHWPGKGLLKKA
jgi:hypothetical protein